MTTLAYRLDSDGLWPLAVVSVIVVPAGAT
jgi:hypothetical protein